ncbi:unnamed protein product [Ilex paraguariensis]|uniref:Uncharacterized protein n=1 Tax=Ilex paraguariensis TaxID=185542 RepID=A0ABC8V580_9AQUA
MASNDAYDEKLILIVTQFVGVMTYLYGAHYLAWYDERRNAKRPKNAEIVAETMAVVANNLARLVDTYEKSKPCINYSQLYKAAMDVEELDLMASNDAYDEKLILIVTQFVGVMTYLYGAHYLARYDERRNAKRPKNAEIVAETMAVGANNLARLVDAYEKSKLCINYSQLYKAAMDVEELDLASRMIVLRT